jgi:hypothetical protein
MPDRLAKSEPFRRHSPIALQSGSEWQSSTIFHVCEDSSCGERLQRSLQFCIVMPSGDGKK